ncbi:MAG TPA: helix-turn-helix transcriptional regulator [Longimicrobium sp.]|nr:helix-turn-helix transcriptional regulator [Longimicrobium sp.]
MTNREWIDRQTATPEARREYEQERLVLWTTERITELMEQSGVSRADLARMLGTSRPNVTALLSGARNMTLRTLADLSCVLGYRADVRMEPLRYGEYTSTPVQVVRNLRPCVAEFTTREPEAAPGEDSAARLVA